jgi:hypothetical protein
MIIIIIIPWLYGLLWFRVYQLISSLTSTCPQTEVTNHLASFRDDMWSVHQVPSQWWVSWSGLLPLHQDNETYLKLHKAISQILEQLFFHITKEIIPETTWKGKYHSMDNTKIGKERGNSYQKNKEISRRKAHLKHTEV